MTGFTRNLGPLLNGGYGNQNMRVSDAERSAVTDRLAVHYGDGRLDQAEFDERAGRAMNAKTRGDLSGLLDDLPEPGPAGAPGTMGAPGTAGPPGTMARPRRSRRHPVLFVALLVFLAMTVVARGLLGRRAMDVAWLHRRGSAGPHRPSRPAPCQVASRTR